jgi:hypothetical protein
MNGLARNLTALVVGLSVLLLAVLATLTALGGSETAPPDFGPEPRPKPPVGQEPSPQEPGYVPFRDARGQFTLDYPSTWAWADVAEPGQPSDARHVLFEDTHTAARIVVSIWENRGASLEDWAQLSSPGWQLPPSALLLPNARVADQAAIMLWHPETPHAPARVAVFFGYGDAIYRVVYSAADGGQAVQQFIKALVSLEVDQPLATDVIPAIPNWNARFYPSRLLFSHTEAQGRSPALPSGGPSRLPARPDTVPPS